MKNISVGRNSKLHMVYSIMNTDNKQMQIITFSEFCFSSLAFHIQVSTVDPSLYYSISVELILRSHLMPLS